MSDIGLFPPGALVWLCSFGWCVVCLVLLVIFLFVAWRRTRGGETGFARDRFVGYAIGVWTSGIVAGLTMSLINWSGSLGVFARWLDQPAASFAWMGMTVASAPLAAVLWNSLRRARRPAVVA